MSLSRSYCGLLLWSNPLSRLAFYGTPCHVSIRRSIDWFEGLAGDLNKLKVVANKETATKEESLLQVIKDFMNLLVNLIHKKYYYRLA